MDCSKVGNKAFCGRQAITGFPEIRLYPIRRQQEENPTYIEYPGFDLRAASLAAWASSYIGAVKSLNENTDWRQVRKQ